MVVAPATYDAEIHVTVGAVPQALRAGVIRPVVVSDFIIQVATAIWAPVTPG